MGASAERGTSGGDVGPGGEGRVGGRRGVFLVLEGVEGSGKTTQARLLAEWLAERGVAHLHVREPGGLPLSEEIRRLLLESEDVPARTELLLMLAARSALVEARIAPALAAGEVVVADRFELSTLAYQAHGRGLPVEEVRRLNAFATGGVRPDLTVVLDVPLEEGERRRRLAGGAPDRIERAGRAFHERVAEAYRLLATEVERVELLDATGSQQEVQLRLRRRLHARYPETFVAG